MPRVGPLYKRNSFFRIVRRFRMFHRQFQFGAFKIHRRRQLRTQTQGMGIMGMNELDGLSLLFGSLSKLYCGRIV
jgi:hypothetical protein